MFLASTLKLELALCKIRSTTLCSHLLNEMKTRYTKKQGQYLAFIYYYTKIHGRAPAEADMERYFMVSPSAVHQMVLMLEKQEYIERMTGEARTIRLLMSREELPDLD